MRPVAVISGMHRRCATCLHPLAVVVVLPAVVLPLAVVVPPIAVVVPPVALLPLAEDEDVRSVARKCPPSSIPIVPLIRQAAAVAAGGRDYYCYEFPIRLG